MSFIKAIKKLTLSDFLLLFPAFFLLVTTKISIKVLPFKYLQKFYQKIVDKGFQNLIPEKEISKKALAINRIANKLPFLQFTCLPKAMALKYWLKNYSAIELHFGVQKDKSNQLIAHAWLSKNEKIIFGEQPEVDYKSIWVWKE